MKRWRCRFAGPVVFWMALAVATCPAGSQDAPGTVAPGAEGASKPGGYLFAHMLKQDYGRLYYSVSTDGLHWTLLNDGRRILDDYRGHPDICRGHDGRYYLIGNYERQPEINLWVSDDLIRWSRFGSFTPDIYKTPDFEPALRYHGAPKIHFDEPSGQYLITWHSTCLPPIKEDTEQFWRGMRTLYVLSKDLRTFSEPRRLFSFEMATIDVIVRREGERYYAFIKDERYPSFEWPTGKTIRICSSPNLTGPWSPPSPPITPNFREAPALIPRPDGRGWYLYYEQYPGVSYGVSTAPRLAGPWHGVYWADYAVPANVRHGCMMAISAEQYRRLVAAYGPLGMNATAGLDGPVFPPAGGISAGELQHGCTIDTSVFQIDQCVVGLLRFMARHRRPQPRPFGHRQELLGIVAGHIRHAVNLAFVPQQPGIVQRPHRRRLANRVDHDPSPRRTNRQRFGHRFADRRKIQRHIQPTWRRIVRPPRPVRSQPSGQRPMRRAPCENEHPAPRVHVFDRRQHQVRRRPETEQPHRLALHDPGQANRPIADHARAQQRCRLRVRQPRRQRIRIILVHRHPLGVAPVGAVARPQGPIAQVLPSGSTIPTRPTRPIQPRDPHPVADPMSPHLLPDRDHPPDHLVPRNHRQPRRDQPPLDFIQLRMTHPAGRHLQQHILRSASRLRPIHPNQRPFLDPRRPFQHQRLHTIRSTIDPQGRRLLSGIHATPGHLEGI